MTDRTEQQLRELFAADAAGAPDAGGLAALARHTAGRRRRARATAAAGLIAAVVVVGGVAAIWGSAGPGAGATSSSTADCSFAVEFDGRLYVGEVLLPYPAEPAAQLGEAQIKPCNDTGPLPSGVGLSEEPRWIPASAYSGYDPAQVISAPDPEGIVVLVSADLPREERLQIIAALQQTGSATG